MYFLKYILITIVLISSATAQEKDLSYYLPKETTYDEKIPTPKSSLGYQVGQWHIRHDQLVSYMKTLATTSARVSIVEYARSYEQRPLLLLTITSPENHTNIENIQKQHQQLSNPKESGKLDLKTMPAVVYMGYTVHGNESSGANAAPLVAYYLASAQGEKIEALLKETVILLDPCMNPDGTARFAHWANMHKGKNLVADTFHREHTEGWPSGRTNHYWFDLNRDWLPVQHPESQGRIVQFQKWLPNILTDHHEMGTNSTYFFQPGVPSRTHPLTPNKNYVLTERIAKFHARALDKVGSLYYTKERFDDFYYGKGSTYPDIHGAIGILFEQASSRGHLQESTHGPLTFPFTIKNQVITSLSTLEAAKTLRAELLEYQRDFYSATLTTAKMGKAKAYVVSSGKDPARLFHFLKLLCNHKIEVYKLAKTISTAGKAFNVSDSYIIPLEQSRYKTIEALFEKRTSFNDSSFYDVSSWTMPLAFNIPFAKIDNDIFSQKHLGSKVEQVTLKKGQIHGGQSNYAYLFSWQHYYAPRAVNRLLSADFKVKVATKPFVSQTNEGTKKFTYGTIMVPVGIQKKKEELAKVIEQIAEKDSIPIYAVTTGFTPDGIDLGSPSFSLIKPLKTLIVVGKGVRAYDAGEVWHLLDQRFNVKLAMVEMHYLHQAPLHKYNAIVLVDGNYSGINEKAEQKLKHWLNEGGVLVAIKSAINWVKAKKIAAVEFVKEEEKKKKEIKYRSYASLDADYGKQVIGGVIAQVKLDLAHPINYGYHNKIIPLFRRGKVFLQPTKNVYATPVQYTDTPLISGFLSEENKAKLKKSAAITVCGSGKGKIICMADNPNFRAFWYGTNKLFLNALFFGRIIAGSAVETFPKNPPKKEQTQEHKH